VPTGGTGVAVATLVELARDLGERPTLARGDATGSDEELEPVG
jgi:hypothetical protein